MGFKCLICGYTQKETVLHTLPKDFQLFKIWTRAAGREDITHDKRRSYRICDIHFSENMKFIVHHNRTNIKADAIPVLHLPAPAMTTATTAIENLSVPEYSPVPRTLVVPSTSTSNTEELHVEEHVDVK